LFQCQRGGFWLYSAVAEMDGSLGVPSIPAELPLVELYDRIEFSSKQPADSIPQGMSSVKAQPKYPGILPVIVAWGRDAVWAW
jgi:hypothetical protein